jgi:DNA replication licensing factor MCM6
MSRFDLFFVVLDECNPVLDERIARHIVRMHRAGGASAAERDAPFTTAQMQLYIKFARIIKPFFKPGEDDCTNAKKELVQCYRALRQVCAYCCAANFSVDDEDLTHSTPHPLSPIHPSPYYFLQGDILGKNKTAYRITVRQLESLIRLSEALARVHCDTLIRPVYVREAFRLLQKSIIFVETEDVELEDIENEMDAIPVGDDSEGGDSEGDGGGEGGDYEGGGGGVGGGVDEAVVETTVRAFNRYQTGQQGNGNENDVAAQTAQAVMQSAGDDAGDVCDTTALPPTANVNPDAGAGSSAGAGADADANKRRSPAAGERGDDQGHVSRKRKKKEKEKDKQTSAMSFDQYTRMTSLIKQYLRNQAEEDKVAGIPFNAIATWYINQPHILALLANGGTDAFTEQKLLVHKVT